MKLKVISLNVWHGGLLFDNMMAFLRQEDPDILLAQEVFNDHDPALERRFRMMDMFQESLPFSDSDFAPAAQLVQDFGKVEEGNAIFSKFPITKRFEPVFFNEPYDDNYVDAPENYGTAARNLQHVIIDVKGVPVDVLNFQGVWDLDGENDSPKRLKMSKVIVDAVQGRPNVILGGDTNVRPNTQTIRNIEQHLTNVFAGELKTTFNIAQKKDPALRAGYASSVVDMLFVSPHIGVGEHWCPDVDISDHLPLVAELDITAEAV